MAFRLQSFLAGAAKEATKNIRALDEEYAESLKNTAANLAKEAQTVRKERTKAILDYSDKGKKLKRDYKLSDAQIQTLLSAGTDSYESFVNSVRAGNQAAKLADPNAQFDAASFAQSLFQGQTAEEGILSLDQQAQAYAARRVPTDIDIQTAASGISAGTQTMLTGVSPEAVAERLRGSVGDIAEYTGPAMGETGLSVSGQTALTPADIIALQAARAGVAKTEAEIGGIKASTKLTGIKGTLVEAQTKTAQLTNQRLPETIQADLDASYASTALKEAQKAGVEQDTSKGILEQAKLKAELDNYQKFGPENEQLAIDLLEAKIAQANRPADLEELQATFVSKASDLRAKAGELDATDPEAIRLNAQATAYDARAANVANMVKAQDTSATTDWSKGSPEKRFAGLLKTNVQAANISGSLNSAGNWEWDFANKRPAYYTAYANTVDQYAELYSDSGNTGLISSLQNKEQLNNVLNQWSQEGSFVDANTPRPAASSQGQITNVDFGSKSVDDLAELQTSGNLQPGDIARTEARIYDNESRSLVTKQVVVMYSTQGEWISAGDF